MYPSHSDHGAVYISNKYVSLYQRKNDMDSANWEVVLRSITGGCVNRDANAPKNLRSLVTKHMTKITHGIPFSRDLAAFVLSGGRLVRSSLETPLPMNNIRRTSSDNADSHHHTDTDWNPQEPPMPGNLGL